MCARERSPFGAQTSSCCLARDCGRFRMFERIAAVETTFTLGMHRLKGSEDSMLLQEPLRT